MKMQHAAVYTTLHWKLKSADCGALYCIINQFLLHIMTRSSVPHWPGSWQQNRGKNQAVAVDKDVQLATILHHVQNTTTNFGTLKLWNLETLKPEQSSASPARWKSEEKQLTVARVNISKYSDQQRPSARWDFGRKQNLVSTFRSLLALTSEI